MRRTATEIVIWLVILCSPAIAWSKGAITKIEIAGAKLPATLEITDRDIVSYFNIWNGPGVSTRNADGVENPPRHLDTTRSAGRFIDWPKGKALDRPSGLDSYKVLFHIAGTTRTYVVFYAFDPAVELGYVYLPTYADGVTANMGLIVHDVEGNWFFSSGKWEELVRPVIEVASKSDADTPAN